MRIKNIFFDLDGTLLPMDQDFFTNSYFRLLTAKLAPYGFAPKELIGGIWAGIRAMVKNDGSMTNEEAFWREFTALFGELAAAARPHLEEFYQIDFQKAQIYCGKNPKAAETVHALKEKGYRLVLATNPIFPSYATESRIRWAGLCPEDFEAYTTYENCCYCKPNPKYYAELADKLGMASEETLMVGNDATEDVAAEKLGMRVFLLTDCLINKEGIDIAKYPHGSFPELMAYIETLG